ncbi:serine hydrolase [Alkalicoccus chagannorensis]|uniref:serine hydrolase n=1 Tax=Alkalicoccus chagannorensis TaxID=427072 RepID=UPI00041FDEED|nr:serine hydrolase [Alkalicoccus chagannorensis]
MQRLLFLLLPLIFIFIAAEEADAAPNSIFVNDKEAVFDRPPELINGTNYIELRGLCNALGYSIGWDHPARTASCSGGGNTLEVSFLEDTYKWNGETRRFDRTPRLISGRSMLSMREVAELFDHYVLWLESSGDVAMMRPGITDEERGKLVDSYLHRIVERGEFQGSAIVEKSGEELLSSSYGYADVSNSRPNSTEDAHAIASISKGFTGIAIMQLEEKGVLSVEDRLAEHLPGAPFASRVTLEDLLTHRSGYPWNYPDHGGIYRLLFEPGTEYRYSNVGYQLLGEVIAEVSGYSYEDYLQKYIAEPAGMENTGFDLATSDRPAVGYTWVNGQRSVSSWDYSARGASGGVFASAEDLVKLRDAVFNDQLMSAEQRERMLKRQKGHWGYGWQQYDHHRGSINQLAGSSRGFRTFMRMQESDHLLILLSNIEETNISELYRSVNKLLY